jgi:cytochrome b
MILGVSLGVILLLRVLWGFMGTRCARFASFLYRPTPFVAYLRGAVIAKTSRYAGHNPDAAYATFAILILIGVVVSAGLLIGVGSGPAEEVHVPAAYALASAVAVHIVGVLWHSWRHRENLTLTMVTAKRRTVGNRRRSLVERVFSGPRHPLEIRRRGTHGTFVVDSKSPRSKERRQHAWSDAWRRRIVSDIAPIASVGCAPRCWAPTVSALAPVVGQFEHRRRGRSHR